MEHGALSVMTTGAFPMLELSVECWDLVTPLPPIDCKSNLVLHSTKYVVDGALVT